MRLQNVTSKHQCGKSIPLEINLPLILIAALISSVSPGPATLAVAGTSMASGRRSGLALASDIKTGSLMWSVAAALGLGAVMLANAWVCSCS
ncbi:LysE family translocator [Ruegeria arenilitoris]|uniref:LysE family translocator n=1 Tax=Ruegeria arenilitoris TaxID=1173585 RepID=UPI003464CB99